MIKSYTDLEQSKKLAEILPFESADKVYYGIHLGVDGEYHLSGDNTENDVFAIDKEAYIKVFGSDICNQLPCWGLTALLELIPSNVFLYSKLVKWDESYYIEHREMLCDNPVDAAFEMIVWLKENGKS